MTTWAGASWEKMCREFDFRRLFEKTGCLMSVEGCNVHFTGAPEYKFIPTEIPIVDTMGNSSNDDASDSDDESLEDDDSVDNEEVENDECGLSDDDEVCDNGGDFNIPKSIHFCKIVANMTEDFRGEMAVRKTWIAHKFDFVGWDVGQIVALKGAGKYKGQFEVKYASDNSSYYHFLTIHDHGSSRSWVALSN